jgi:hypothetical protein
MRLWHVTRACVSSHILALSSCVVCRSVASNTSLKHLYTSQLLDHLSERSLSLDNEYLGTQYITGRNRISDPYFFCQTEHRNPEGRTYWFNTGTRDSVWEKPDGTWLYSAIIMSC